MTYKDVRDVISGWIVSNCYNVQSMRLPECFQANYAKTLTADDVTELYKIGAQVDKIGKLYCGELIEE